MFFVFIPTFPTTYGWSTFSALNITMLARVFFMKFLSSHLYKRETLLSINVSRDLAWFVLNSESAGIQSRFARSSWLWHGWGHGKLRTLSLPEVEVAEGGDASDDNTGCDHSHGMSAHLQSPPSRQIIKTGPSWAEWYLPVEESLQIS